MKGTLIIALGYPILLKESETSNPYCAAVPYRSTSKNNKSRRLKHILNRIKWFYEAPVVRFYYNFVSIYFTALLCISTWMLPFYLVFRYSSSYFWVYSVMFFFSIIFPWTSIVKSEPVLQIYPFQSLKLSWTFGL